MTNFLSLEVVYRGKLLSALRVKTTGVCHLYILYPDVCIFLEVLIVIVCNSEIFIYFCYTIDHRC